MKHRPLILSLLIVLIDGTAYAADNAVASVDIAEVSERIELTDGLYIVDATEYPTDTRLVIDSSTGEWITLAQPFSDPTHFGTQLIDVDTFLGYNVNEFPVGSTKWHRVFLYSMKKGATHLIRTPIATSERLPSEASQMHPVGFYGRSLVIYLHYYTQPSPSPDNKTVLVTISGDWESLGVDLPDETPSADLNRDGKVDSTDLLILQSQWDPK